MSTSIEAATLVYPVGYFRRMASRSYGATHATVAPGKGKKTINEAITEMWAQRGLKPPLSRY